VRVEQLSRLLGVGIFLMLAALACSLGAPAAPTSAPADPTLRVPDTAKSAESLLTTPLPTATLAPIPVSQSTSLPATSTPVSLSTPALSTVAGCLPASPLSLVYLPNSAFIAEILPLADGNFLLRGQLDNSSGTWLVKVDAAGHPLWQNVYGSELGRLHPAFDGSFVLEFGKTNLRIALDGSVMGNGLIVPWVHPNPDGGHTFVSGGRAARYFSDPQKPDWNLSITNFGGYNTVTSDGGALFAYAGVYVDTSVYWAPQYTDLKVIKISPEGEVLQRVYGKLVGYETLDFFQATEDGGALLAGTHAYEELGTDMDIWLMKLNASGSLSWQTTLKLPPNNETLRAIHFLKNGYLVIASTLETDNPVLVRLKPNGSLNWQKVLSSSRGPVEISAVADTADGGLLLAGETWEKTNVYWLARLDARGNLLWEKTIGYYGLRGASGNEIEAILPLENGEILIAGNTDLVGDKLAATSSAWLARISDAGQSLGFLSLQPGKFTLTTTLGSRPNTLPDEILPSKEIFLNEMAASVQATDLQPAPACLPPEAFFPTPAVLPTLTPSVTPTPSFARDLFLASPPVQGDDVLKLQQRLLELGYTEVGAPDGVFGKMTDTAVRRFQERNGLEVDGYVGPKTWATLFHPEAVPASK
jgi:hypothetical protein